MKWAARLVSAFSAMVAACTLISGPAGAGRATAPPAPAQASPDKGE